MKRVIKEIERKNVDLQQKKGRKTFFTTPSS